MDYTTFLSIYSEIVSPDLRNPIHLLRAVDMVGNGASSASVAAELRTTVRKVNEIVRQADPLAYLVGFTTADIPVETLERAKLILGQLVIGRAAEVVFETEYKQEMGASELQLIDLREGRTDTDYRVVNGSSKNLYRINIKFHGSRFRRSEELVGLTSDDCFPLATYKIYNALQKQEAEHLPYMFVVVSPKGVTAKEVGDSIDDRLVNFLCRFIKPSRLVGRRLVEDRIVQFLQITSAVPFEFSVQMLGNADWNIISARKAHLLLHSKLYDRVFALRTRNFARAFKGAELDMHFSLKADMTPLRQFLQVLKQEGLTKVASLLERGTY